MEMLYRLLELTAWEMTEPKPYGLFHVLFVLVGGGLCLWGAYGLRNVGERGHRLILLAAGLFLAISEVYKQLFYTYYLNHGLYHWSILPFQLCSVPMYLCLLLAGLPRCRLSETMETFLGTYNLLGGLMALLVPPGLCHEYWTLTLHAFLWHLLLVFLGFYLTFSGRADYGAAAMKRATGLFVLLCGLAVAVNVLLWEVSEGAVNLFYLGPSPTPQPVFKTITVYVGWEITALLYMACIVLGAYVTAWCMEHVKNDSQYIKEEQMHLV